MSQIPESVRMAAAQQAEAMRSELAGVVAVVIATVDGFDIASAVTRGIDPARAAAMASSISAIGSVVSKEAGLGQSRSVTINTDAGFACLSTVYRSDIHLIVNVIANGDAVLGQVAWRSAECVKALEAE
ncbi:MAG: hypothetical protein ABW051_07290 [Burkholderiaceae bacterium]